MFKQIKKVKSGKKAKLNFKYLNNLKELQSSKSTAKTVEDVCDFVFLEKMLQVRSAFHLDQTWTSMQESKASSAEKTNELFATEVEKAAKYHIGYIMFQLTQEAMNENQFKDPNVKEILQIMLKIYSLKLILEDLTGLYEIGFFGQGASKLLNEALDF